MFIELQGENMNKFSKNSRKELNSCDPRLQSIFNKVLEIIDCTIIEGYRSTERQLQLYKSKDSEVSFGKHNFIPSRAVDAASYPIDWDDTKKNDLKEFYYFAGIVKGVSESMGYKIRWGGDWDSDNDLDDQTFNDLVHFELVD